MLFRISQTEKTDNIVLVTGSTACGTLKGVWKSRNIAPEIGNSYNIELTLGLNTGTVERSGIVIGSSETSAEIRMTDDSIIFTGRCEEIEDIYFIRFSDDGLEMLDITNDDHTIKAGDLITFPLRFDEIGIYPY